ncbi:hypothetical protein Areg01_47010 [Actinoplanes regularis]|nr:hypothetical protein Areg01_47010 [Actinoplanes regularis]
MSIDVSGFRASSVMPGGGRVVHDERGWGDTGPRVTRCAADAGRVYIDPWLDPGKLEALPSRRSSNIYGEFVTAR